MSPTKVDGVDYTPEGIDELRDALGVYRQRAMDNWPEGIEMTLVLTHAIALLAYLRDLIREGEQAPSPPKG